LQIHLSSLKQVLQQAVNQLYFRICLSLGADRSGSSTILKLELCVSIASAPL